MREFTVKGVNYRARRLNAFEQIAVARKLAPALSILALQPDKRLNLEGFPRAFCGLTAGLPQADVADVLNVCLGAVQRQQPQNWANLMVAGGHLMFDDADDLDTILQIVWHVIDAARLIDFFAESPSGSAGDQPATS